MIIPDPEKVQTVTVGDVPCCMTIEVTTECRLKSSYGQKCGYLPQPYAALAQPRYFREVTGSITSTIVGTLTYTDLVPEEPAERAGDTTCSYSFTASCEDPSGTWTINFDYDTAELGGETRSGTDTGTGDGNTTETICVGALAAFLGTSGPYADEFTEYSLAYSFTAATEGAESGGCVPFGVNASGTNSGHVFDFYEYDWEESYGINGTIELCDEHTLAILMEDTDADAEASDPGEWDTWGEEGASCCGRREVSADQTLYYVDFLEVRFLFDPPCYGTVRVHYTVTTTTNGVDTTETLTVDNPSGPIEVAVPAVPADSYDYLVTVCITEVTAEIVL